GFPIRTSQDHGLVTGSLGLFAGSHVLHRLLTPRHPPCALYRLITSTQRPQTSVADEPTIPHSLPRWYSAHGTRCVRFQDPNSRFSTAILRSYPVVKELSTIGHPPVRRGWSRFPLAICSRPA